MPTWPAGPIAPLPRTVTPFSTETVQSYLDRLAHANHLRPNQLKRYLTDGQPGGYPRHDWLSIASNVPVYVLRSRLAGLFGHDRDWTRQRRHARPACRLCMARRGVYEPVYCWLPAYRTVCYRHRRWIGPGADKTVDQRDLRLRPAVITAARRHARLHRDYGDTANDAVTDAARILRWWANGIGAVPTTSNVDTRIANYPELVGLAQILADLRRRIWASDTTTPARAHAIKAVYTRTSHWFPGHAHRDRPIEQWIHDQTLIAARLRRPPAGQKASGPWLMMVAGLVNWLGCC